MPGSKHRCRRRDAQTVAVGRSHRLPNDSARIGLREMALDRRSPALMIRICRRVFLGVHLDITTAVKRFSGSDRLMHDDQLGAVPETSPPPVPESISGNSIIVTAEHLTPGCHQLLRRCGVTRLPGCGRITAMFPMIEYAGRAASPTPRHPRRLKRHEKRTKTTA